MKEIRTNKTKLMQDFKIIFEDKHQVIPEINNIDFFTFGMAFMKIRARELNYSKVKSED